jgi:hypothetical protein
MEDEHPIMPTSNFDRLSRKPERDRVVVSFESDQAVAGDNSHHPFLKSLRGLVSGRDQESSLFFKEIDRALMDGTVIPYLSHRCGSAQRQRGDPNLGQFHRAKTYSVHQREDNFSRMEMLWTILAIS